MKTLTIARRKAAGNASTGRAFRRRLRSGATCVLIAAALVVAGARASAAPPPEQGCEAAKAKAAGKHAACLANERAKEVLGRTPDPWRCTRALQAAFGRAEAKARSQGGSCPTEFDSPFVDAKATAAQGRVNAYLAGSRFIDNGDGTIVDTVTGLQWEKKVAGSGCLHCVDDTYGYSLSSHVAPDGPAFSQFLAMLNDCPGGPSASNAVGFAGRCDWRLPTISELWSIVDATVPDCGTVPCIDPVFGPTSSGSYWSSSASGSNPTAGLCVLAFRAGGFCAIPGDLNSGSVRAVRGGW